MSNRGSCFAWSFSHLTSIASTAISTMLAGAPDVTTWSTRPNTLCGNLTRSSKSLLKWRFMRLPFSELLSHLKVADILCYVCRTTSFDKCKWARLIAAQLAQGCIRQGCFNALDNDLYCGKREVYESPVLLHRITSSKPIFANDWNRRIPSFWWNNLKNRNQTGSDIQALNASSRGWRMCDTMR